MPGTSDLDDDLTADDVAQYTKGRLSADDPETQRMLDAALAAARRDVGWRVSPPVLDDTVILDGPGSRILRLPTQKLNELTSITEDGIALDLDELRWSATDGHEVHVRKRNHTSWSCYYRSIEVVMDHGYTAEEAGPWRQGILAMVDEMSTTGRSDADLSAKSVDDVSYSWFANKAEQALFSVSATLDIYRVGQVHFV